MGLGAESASPALPLPLRNPGHIVWCLSSAPPVAGGRGQRAVVTESQGAVGSGSRVG